MRLLDLFCGAGGAAMGYHQAGFGEIVGVDIDPQPDYPFDFVQADALDPWWAHEDWDLIHASPPCQTHSALAKGTNDNSSKYPDHIDETRRALRSYGHTPYVIENVAGAPIRKDLMLCGEMFGLGVIRHRYFEMNWDCLELEHVPHRGRVAGYRHGEWFDGPYFAVYGEGGGKGTVEQWQQAMGIDWTSNRKSIAEAIPPAYTEFIGNKWLHYEKTV